MQTQTFHLDDHSRAYAVWAEGAGLVPSDARLARQRRKRDIWAPAPAAAVGEAATPGDCDAADARIGHMLGRGVVVTDADADCIAHVLPPPSRLPPSPLSAAASDAAACAAVAAPDEPALALFNDASQRRRVAFTTRAPVLTPAECRAVLAEVDAHVAGALGGRWGSVRRATVPTTDIAVEDVPALVPWLRALLATRLFPMLAACFPLLADGSRLAPGRLRVHDAFVVRYDAARGSTSLPEHSDTSACSVSLSLNERGRDFEGGGLFLRCLGGAGAGACAGAAAGAGAGSEREHEADGAGGVFCAPEGCATAFMGPLRHGGAPITRGVRVILVLFLYVEGFAYGRLLRHVGGGGHGAAIAAARRAGAGAGAGAAGAAAQGEASATAQAQTQPVAPSYVVYRETVQLMEALEGDSGASDGADGEGGAGGSA